MKQFEELLKVVESLEKRLTLLESQRPIINVYPSQQLPTYYQACICNTTHSVLCPVHGYRYNARDFTN